MRVLGVLSVCVFIGLLLGVVTSTSSLFFQLGTRIAAAGALFAVVRVSGLATMRGGPVVAAACALVAVGLAAWLSPLLGKYAGAWPQLDLAVLVPIAILGAVRPPGDHSY